MSLQKLMMTESVVRLSSRVVSALGLNPGPYTLNGTNTYLVGTGPKKFLIDTGEGIPDYVEVLRSAMKLSGGDSLEGILITHAHPDHIGGIPDVLNHFGGRHRVPIYKGLPDHIPSSTVEKGSSTCPHGAHGTSSDSTPSGYLPLEDGQTFQVEGATLRAIRSPGHTLDHFCFLLEEEQAIFTGDCILGMGSAVFSDLRTYLNSLHHLQSFNPKTLYPGHGPFIQDDPQNPNAASRKIQEYISHRLKREQQILHELRRLLSSQPNPSSNSSVTTSELVEAVYVSTTPPSLIPAATSNLLLHLHKLELDGQVLRNPSPSEDRWSLLTASTASTPSSL